MFVLLVVVIILLACLEEEKIILKRSIICCQLAYQIPHRGKYKELLTLLQQQDCLLSYRAFHHPKVKNYVSGYILYFENEIVIAFRGTIVDGNIRPEIWNNLNQGIVYRVFAGYPVGIHRGVYNEYSQIRSCLVHHIFPEILHDKRPIVFTGHSLGGMCQLAALDFYHLAFLSWNLSRIPRIKCITFGVYKMFSDANIFHVLDMENIRVKFQKDYITLHPFFSIFKHVHTREIIFNHGFYHRICYYRQYIDSLF